MDRVNVLVTCAGAAPAIAVLSALKDQDEIRTALYAVNSYIAAGFFLSDFHEVVPLIKSRGYIDHIIKVCRKQRIDVVFPIHDDELLLFAERLEDFRDIGVSVVSSQEKTIRLCRDKSSFYKYGIRKGLRVPKTLLPSRLSGMKESLGLPVIVKPRSGMGSSNVFLARTEKELRFFVRYVENCIVQEYLPGREFTIDFVTDAKGRPLVCVPRERIETKAGVAVRARTIRDEKLEEFVRGVAEVIDLSPRGNVQCKIAKDGTTKLVEVNPKFSASLPVTTKAGVNIPLILLKQICGQEVRPPELVYEAGIGMARYLDQFFFDFESGVKL